MKAGKSSGFYGPVYIVNLHSHRNDIMKKIFFTLLVLFVLQATYAQILNPVRFSYSAVKKGSNQYEVHIKSVIDPKWHIYSVTNPEGGAEATVVKMDGVKTIGKVKEVGKMKTVFDKEFKMNQKFFESNVDFVQLVTIQKGDKKVAGSVTYMVCNDRQCLPPKEVAFEIKL